MSAGVVNKQTGERIPTAGMPAIDNALDLTSVNPVQNAVITAALANKQDKTDNSLQTTDKTVVGAVNELKSGLTNANNAITALQTSFKGKVYNTRTVSIPADNWCCGIYCCNINGVGDSAGYFMFQNGVLVNADTFIKAVDNMLTITYSNGSIIFEPQSKVATIRSLAIMLS